MERRNDDVTLDLSTRGLGDAEQIITAVVELLTGMTYDAFRGIEGGYGKRGHILNNALPFLKAVRERQGDRIDRCREALNVSGKRAEQ